MKYILAHDLGTSGNKATLFSDEGKMITSEVFRYSSARPKQWVWAKEPRMVYSWLKMS